MSRSYQYTRITVPGVSWPSGQIVAPAKARPLHPVIPEESALDHWVLGGSSASLTSLAGAKSSLTLNDLPPQYGDNYAKPIDGYPAHPYNGLKTIYDGLTTQTIIVVARRRSVTNVPLIGNANTNSGQGGAGLSFTETTLDAIARGALPISMTPSAPPGAVMFCAHVMSGSSHFAYIGGQGASAGQSGALVPANPGRKIAIGPVHHSLSTWTTGTLIFEAIYYDRALSIDELDAVYARAITRAGQRGFTIWSP